MRFLIIFLAIMFCPLSVPAENYDQYLMAARKHIKNGNVEKASIAYNVYVEMTGKEDKAIEYAISGDAQKQDKLVPPSNGEGAEYYPNGTVKYIGNWKIGKRDGKGTEYRRNGTVKFVGNWKGGERNGEGIKYRRNGKIKMKGHWVDGEFKQGVRYTIFKRLFLKDGYLYWQGPNQSIPKKVVCIFWVVLGPIGLLYIIILFLACLLGVFDAFHCVYLCEKIDPIAEMLSDFWPKFSLRWIFLVLIVYLLVLFI